MNPKLESTARGVYRHQDLRRLLAPASVAVLGASQSPAPFGSRVIAKLDEAGFRGEIFPINPKYSHVGDRPCFASIAALPRIPDCVVIAVPREAVQPAVEEAAQIGIGGAIIFASGYAETRRADRIAQQQALADISRRSGLRILGPNCIGLINYNNGFQATFGISPFSKELGPRAIGLISQSGGLAFSLAQAMEHGISLSHVLTLGNSCDVDVADQISFLADDPSCHAIACVFEGTPNPSRLLEAAKIAHAAGKPLVIYKMGVGSLGATAAMSHTGILAGARAAYQAAFRRAGIIEVDSFEGLLEATAFFAKARRPKASGVAVLATTGGACVLFADNAEKHGVPLPQPGDATRAVLERVVPDFGSPRNPCDVTGQVQASPDALFACVDALLADERYGALVIPQPHASDQTRERLKVFSDAARRHDKIVASVWLSEWLEGPGAMETELDPHVAIFRSTHRCFAALAAWNEREEWLRSASRVSPRTASAQAARIGAELIASAQTSVLTEHVAKQVLAAYGIPVVPEQLVQSASEALAAANALGYPVALKVASPDLPHKTEAGVVRLGIKDKAELLAAYETIMTNARKGSSAPRIAGVLVQPMLPQGVEVMVGARIDPLFGPLVMVGLGGVMVELLKDTVLELAPVAPWQARAMIERLKGRALLTGFRGSDPIDLGKLAGIVARASELIADQRELIAEIDINPLICAGADIVAVDALIVKAAAGT